MAPNRQRHAPRGWPNQPVEVLDEGLSVEEPDANLQMEETDVNPKSALAALPEEVPDDPPQEEGPIDLTVDDEEPLSNEELVQRCRDAVAEMVERDIDDRLEEVLTCVTSMAVVLRRGVDTLK